MNFFNGTLTSAAGQKNAELRIFNSIKSYLIKNDIVAKSFNIKQVLKKKIL